MMDDLQKMTQNLFGGTTGAQGEINEEDLMKQMQEMLKVSEDNPDMKTALDSMLKELIGKDVLAEPLRLMHDKFPEFLQKNKEKLSAEDFERYSKQETKIAEILAFFENKDSKQEDLVQHMD